jgi:hypothetical protein
MAVRKVGPVLVVVALSILAWGAQATTAEAHVGSQARLYVPHFDVQPGGTPGTWTVMAHIVDEDSGRPEPGLDASVTGRAANGAFGPVTLADPMNTGMYSGTFSAGVGAVSVVVDARSGPGSEPAIPLQRTWNLVLHEGGGAQSAQGGLQGHAHHGGLGVGPLLAGLLAGAVLLTGLVLVVGRRQRLVPAER